MNGPTLHETLHRFWKSNRQTAFAMFAAVCLSGVVADSANALYILTDAEKDAIVLDQSAEIQDFSSQLVYLTTSSTGYDVNLAPGKSVTLTHNGETTSTLSKRENISTLLQRMDVTPGPMDMVAVDLSDNSVKLTVDDQITYYEHETEPDQHKTVRVANPSLPKGKERVKQAGADGERTSVYEVVWSGGKMVSRQFVETLDSTAVDEIIEYGTAAPVQTATASKQSHAQAKGLSNVTKNADGSGVLTLADGTKLPFSGTKQMTATAYTSGHDGVGQITATGTKVRKGTVAVDKRVIPLGSKLYIVTNDGIVYGQAVAEDTGVRGNAIDLYHDTYQQCINFGRRGCTVYILK